MGQQQGHTVGWTAHSIGRDETGDHYVIHSAPDSRGRVEQIAVVHEKKNARLIAAAPELLEALEQASAALAEAIRRCPELGDTNFHAYVFTNDKAVHAIKKAKGA